MRTLFALLMGALLAAPVLATAQDAIPPSPIVKAELIVNAPQVKSGTPVDAAVTFTMPKEWHIYWKNPGDSGIPTSLAWTLPDGLKAGEIEWPTPERIEMNGLANYGYSNNITLPVALTPSQDDITGNITAKASWLVCKDICIPESATLSAPLAANATAAKAIAAARQDVPMDATNIEGWSAHYLEVNGMIKLTINALANLEKPTNVTFSPLDDGIIANYPAGTFEFNEERADSLTVTFPRGNTDLLPTLNGVLTITHANHTKVNILIAAHLASDTPSTSNPSAAASPTSPLTTHYTLLTALLLAFLGGLVLNIMPCVLPILALKALALSKKAAASRVAAAQQGFSYTAGVVASFLLIAAVMLALKASGNAIGWGFQLQNAGFVAFLAVVMLLVSANLFGLFELPVLFGEKATGINEHKLSGSFATGVLAVMVATPCTAPFMATAIGATLTFPTTQALAVFAALGLGMASPFLLISLWPAARRLLPKPGAWMKRFKHILAIPMLATAAWLVWVLVQIMSPTPMVKTDLREAYSAARLAELRGAGKPLLVDATAAWCITCKINERVALNPADMQQFLRKKNVTILVADWTNSDPEITAYLASFGRNGVPLVVYYPPKGEPVVLPQVLTPSIVREVIEPLPR